MLDFRISQSAEDSSTAPSSFLLTVIGLPYSSLVRLKGAKFTKEDDNCSVDKLLMVSSYDVTIKLH